MNPISVAAITRLSTMFGSMIPVPIVTATFRWKIRKATKLKKAAQMTAIMGVSTRVDTMVATELAAFGFRWFDSAVPAPLSAWLDDPDAELVAHNHRIAARHFNLADLPERLDGLLGRLMTGR